MLTSNYNKYFMSNKLKMNEHHQAPDYRALVQNPHCTAIRQPPPLALYWNPLDKP